MLFVFDSYLKAFDEMHVLQYRQDLVELKETDLEVQCSDLRFRRGSQSSSDSSRMAAVAEVKKADVLSNSLGD